MAPRKQVALRLPLDADAEALTLGDVVFLKGAFNRLFAVSRSDREGQTLRLALQQVDAPAGLTASQKSPCVGKRRLRTRIPRKPRLSWRP